MALGAEHVQPAELDDLVVLGAPGRLDLAHAALQLAVEILRLFDEPFAEQRLLDLELRAAAEDDVDAAAGHVRRDRDRVHLPGLRDDVGLFLVLLRVQHVMRDPAAVERARQPLGLLDRDRADQHRLPGLVPRGDVVDEGRELPLLGLVDLIALVLADHVAVRGDLDDAHLVDVLELGGFGERGTGHAAELPVHAEVILDRDRGERDVLFFDADALLGLDRLVHALGVPPSFEHAAGELVDDLHLAAGHDVVDVLLVELLRPERVLQVVDERRRDVVVQVLDAEDLLDLVRRPSR